MVDSRAWHSLPCDAVAVGLGVDFAAGLDATEVALRKQAHGANRLPEPPLRSAWLLFLNQFRNVLILLLLAAAALAAAIGNVKDAVVIVLVVVLNALVGFYQEHRAERSLAALKKMLPARARVRRGGAKLDVPAEDLVPGDVVLLEAGDCVPAMRQLAIVVPVALLLVMVLLYMALGSVWNSLLVLLILPFALVGWVIAVVAFQMPVSVSAAVAFIVLLGIAVQNGVVLVAFFRPTS